MFVHFVLYFKNNLLIMDKFFSSFIKFSFNKDMANLIKMEKFIKILQIIFFSLFTFISYYGCISYTAKSLDKLEITSSKPKSFSHPQAMSYFIANGTMFFGREKLEEVLNRPGYFLSPKKAFDPVQDELFLRINITSKNPKTWVVFFHYISLYFYTILPAWTSNSGYMVEFHAIKNDQTILKKEYNIFRKSFIWILVLPVSWVNFFTTHESEVFEYITTDFLSELSNVEESNN